MDVYILLDALAKCVGSEERELCRIAELALTFILDTATTITGDKERACELPLFEVAVDKMCGCCYERAWYSKSGGYVLTHVHVLIHYYTCIDPLLYMYMY